MNDAASACDRLVPGTRRIAVLRANAIGDLLLATPALEAVKAAYPAAEVVLLAQRWHRDFLHGRPGPVDRVVVLPPIRGVSVPDDAVTPAHAPPWFLHAMRTERFDVALQLHGGGRYSNPFVQTLGARVSAGPQAPGAAPLDRTFPYAVLQHEVLRHLETAALVGARPLGLEPRVTVTGGDLEEAAAAVPASRRPLAVLHPGAADPRRRWPAEGFVAVADVLAARGADVAVTGSEADTELVVRVASSTRRPALALAGALTLGGLAGLMSRCALVVGNDTGPLHLARAVGARTAAVYWIGNLVTSGPLSRSRHRAAVSWRLHCPCCGAPVTEERCPHDLSFVAEVTVDEMASHAVELLEDARREA